MGYIYLINELDTNNYKIGVTKSTDVKKRMKALETGNSDELFISRTFTTDNPYKLEGMLHRHYKKNHKAKEWFVLSDDEAIDFINVCKKYDSIISFLKLENPFY